MAVRVADIFAAAGSGSFAGRTVAAVVAAAYGAILACRTAELGGHVTRCANGHVVGVWYNACRNRNCPRCAFVRVQRWLERQATTLLGCAHHHIIFTLPHDVAFLWPANYAALGELLFHCARDALFELAADPRYLGARPGALLALHTWGQQLALHPHVHCLVTAGGVDRAGTWVPAPRRHFLPAEPLSQLFRGKFLYGLRGLARTGRLRLPPAWTAAEVDARCDALRHKRWNVYVCERYDHPTGVLNYLGRYLHGGPIAESRLLGFDGATVTFRYKDYRDPGPDGPRPKVLSLGRDEFIRRYLQHVPPKGFHLVRGYGLYRRGGSSEALRRRVRDAVPLTPQLHAALTSRLPVPPDAAAPSETCPTCGARLIVVWAAPRAAPRPRLAA
jgi:hypothetical protein